MFLFKVEDLFEIKGRGLILVPGLGDKVKFAKIGNKIKLIRPDKSEIEAIISGIAFQRNYDILVDNLKKEDVPIGTEVWLITLN